ncbi:hypothetical protein [Nocardia sp. NPDC057227]|uniref:hypothetical protein n=1 Tax=Nocardia sp. NPDC057227 TaxID=3346056 RepID=UPI00363326CF
MRQRRPRFRGAAALAVLGLYLAGLIRLAISGDWHDLAASKMIAMAGIVAGVLVIVSAGLQYGRPKRPWTRRRRIVTAIFFGAVLAGNITWFVYQDTGWGQLLVLTLPIGTMLFFILD